ncbi:hypothetical protein GCM10022397_36920 [Flavivirga jejuensis]
MVAFRLRSSQAKVETYMKLSVLRAFGLFRKAPSMKKYFNFTNAKGDKHLIMLTFTPKTGLFFRIQN